MYDQSGDPGFQRVLEREEERAKQWHGKKLKQKAKNLQYRRIQFGIELGKLFSVVKPSKILDKAITNAYLSRLQYRNLELPDALKIPSERFSTKTLMRIITENMFVRIVLFLTVMFWFDFTTESEHHTFPTNYHQYRFLHFYLKRFYYGL
jgi:hypothetical protein